jgi:3-hydroxy-3-methylglutaryl CoA synthase
VDPACIVNKNIGNIYTGSVFASLLSVVCGYGNNLIGKRIFMFSYGSGSMASMYRFVCQAVCVFKPRLFLLCSLYAYSQFGRPRNAGRQ